LEEGEVLPPKPIPHTHVAINRTDLATGLVAAATWSSSSLTLPKKSRPRGTTILRNATRSSSL
jgi:hypothetical protein